MSFIFLDVTFIAPTCTPHIDLDLGIHNRFYNNLYTNINYVMNTSVITVISKFAEIRGIVQNLVFVAAVSATVVVHTISKLNNRSVHVLSCY